MRFDCRNEVLRRHTEADLNSPDRGDELEFERGPIHKDLEERVQVINYVLQVVFEPGQVGFLQEPCRVLDEHREIGRQDLEALNDAAGAVVRTCFSTAPPGS